MFSSVLSDSIGSLNVESCVENPDSDTANCACFSFTGDATAFVQDGSDKPVVGDPSSKSGVLTRHLF